MNKIVFLIVFLSSIVLNNETQAKTSIQYVATKDGVTIIIAEEKMNEWEKVENYVIGSGLLMMLVGPFIKYEHSMTKDNGKLLDYSSSSLGWMGMITVIGGTFWKYMIFKDESSTRNKILDKGLQEFTNYTINDLRKQANEMEKLLEKKSLYEKMPSTKKNQ